MGLTSNFKISWLPHKWFAQTEKINKHENKINNAEQNRKIATYEQVEESNSVWDQFGKVPQNMNRYDWIESQCRYSYLYICWVKKCSQHAVFGGITKSHSGTYCTFCLQTRSCIVAWGSLALQLFEKGHDLELHPTLSTTPYCWQPLQWSTVMDGS